MKKQPEVTEQTKKNLKDAFCRLYTKMPIEKISINKIATAAGYNRSTFYLYYNDIYDIRSAVEQDILDSIRENIEAENHKDNIPFLQHVMKIYEQNELELQAVMGKYGDQSFVSSFKQGVVSMGLDVGIASNHPYYPYAVEYHVSVILSMFQLWVSRGKDIPADELFLLTDSLYRSGLSYLSKEEK